MDEKPLMELYKLDAKDATETLQSLFTRTINVSSSNQQAVFLTYAAELLSHYGSIQLFFFSPHSVKDSVKFDRGIHKSLDFFVRPHRSFSHLNC